MKEWIKVILAFICLGVAIACDIAVIIFQMILTYQKFGVIINSNAIIVPHWSLWLLLANILIVIGYLLLAKENKK